MQAQMIHVTPCQRSAVRLQRRDDKPTIIEGYAAVFYKEGDAGTQYQLWDSCYERIMPGAFDRALQEVHDVRGLFNHNRDHLLGRVSSGTLRLSVDSVGLKYELDAPDTTIGRDTLTSIERGDLSGSSFAFIPIPTRSVWVKEGDTEIRLIEDLDLYDVGPVTFPAYQSTTTSVRSASREEVMKELEAWRASRMNPDEVEVRMQLVRLDA